MRYAGGASRTRATGVAPAARVAAAGLLLVSMLVLGAGDGGAHSPHDDIGDIAVAAGADGDVPTIFVISRGRLQRSSDLGATWQDLVIGFGRAPLARVALSSADERLILATSRGEGVYRSTDGGDTWATANTGLDDLSLQEVAVSPRSELAFASGAFGGLFRSEDAGDSWSRVEGFGVVSALTIADEGTGRVVVGDADGRLSVSDDGGLTWEHATPVEGGGAITALASSAAGPDQVLVAATADGHVLRATDAGTSFDVLAATVPGGEPRGVALDPEDADALWVSTADDGAVRSSDGGASWQRRPAGLTKSEQADQFDIPHFRAIRAVQVDGRTELLLAGFDGLFRSSDDGARWDPIETAADYIAGLALSPGFGTDRTVAVMTYVKGGFISDDAGETWRTMNEGLRYDGLSEGNRLLPLRRAHNVVFSPDYARDRTIFSATWPQLIKTVDGGETWEEVQIEQPGEGWSPLRQYVLAVSPGYADDRTVFAGNRHGQVFRSEAGGDGGTWSEVAPVDGRVRTVVLSPAYTDDGVVFVSSVGGVFKSLDRGATWQATGPGRSPLATGSERDPAPLLSMSPGFPADGTVFAGTHTGLFVTRDAGATWSKVVDGDISDTADVAAVSVSSSFPDDGVVLVSLTGQGLYRSTDGGASFSAVGDDLAAANRVIADYDNPTSSPIQFSPTFATDQTVFAYAGPDVVRSTDGGVTWDVLALPSIHAVADSLGVAVDALNRPEGASSDPEAETGARRTFETPVGVLSVRRLAVAAAVGLALAVLLTVLRLGRGWDGRTRWAVRVAAAVGGFVGAAALLAA